LIIDFRTGPAGWYFLCHEQHHRPEKHVDENG
jgi:hypothetical protein